MTHGGACHANVPKTGFLHAAEGLRESQGVSGVPRRPLKARRSQLRPERLPDAGLAEWLPPDAPSRSLWGVGLVKLT